MSPFLKSPMRILVPLPRVDLFLGYAYLGGGQWSSDDFQHERMGLHGISEKQRIT